ncbi:MAG: LysE family transporter [Burkholderiaceae bacterium]|nr:LysE family transporter [Burkholderiaceae bacterium]
MEWSIWRAFFAASSSVFAIVKWLGVAYLPWLGISQWHARLPQYLASVRRGA